MQQGHIVGEPGREGGGRKIVDIFERKLLHLGEQPFAQIGGKTYACGGGMFRIAEPGEDRKNGEQEHHSANPEDIGDILALDAGANDIGHQDRLENLADHVKEHEQNGDDNRFPIRFQIGKKQFQSDPSSFSL